MTDQNPEQKAVAEASESGTAAPNAAEQKPATEATEGTAAPNAAETATEKTETATKKTESAPSGGRQTRSQNGRDRDDRSSKNEHKFYKSAEWKKMKEDFDTNPIQDPVEIRQQVEFYFSPFNLPKDDHMKDLTGYPDNKPVPIKELATFTRMRRYGPFSAIVDALKESDVLEVVDGVSPEVRRKEPLSAMKITEEEKAMDDSRFWGLYERKCSIYVKGFKPVRDVKQHEIENLYKPFGAKAVRMRKAGPIFKGSVFISFEDQAARDAFLARDDKPVWGNEEMIYKPKEVYCEEKLKELDPPIAPEDETFPEFEYGYRKKLQEEQKKEWEERNPDGAKRGGFRPRGRGNHRGGRFQNGGRGGRDRGGSDNWRERRDREQDADGQKKGDTAEAAKPAQVDKDGVPVIATVSKVSASTNMKEMFPDKEDTTSTKKREREDDGAGSEGASAENKKQKTDETQNNKDQTLPVV